MDRAYLALNSSHSEIRLLHPPRLQQLSNTGPDILNIVDSDTEYYGVAYGLQRLDRTAAAHPVVL